MSSIKLFLLILLISTSSMAQVECEQYFKELLQTHELALFNLATELTLPTTRNPQEIFKNIQNKTRETLQVIRPYLNGQAENSYFVVQYVSHRIATTLELVNAITYSHGLIEVQTTASSLLSQHLQALRSGIEKIDKLVNERRWYSRLIPRTKLLSYAISTTQSKNQIPAVKEKVSAETADLAQKLAPIRSAEQLLIAEIYYLDEIIKYIAQSSHLESSLFEAQSLLMNKIGSIRGQQALLRTLITNYEFILNLGQKELASTDLLLENGYAASYMQHKSLFDRAAQKIEGSKSNSEKKYIELQSLITLSSQNSLLSGLLEFVKENSFLSYADALLILERMPRGLAWGWRNANPMQEDLFAHHQMIRYGIRNYQTSSFETLDYNLAVEVLVKTRGPLSLDQKSYLKMQALNIFQSSSEYKAFNASYVIDYERLIDKILLNCNPKG